MPLMPVVLSCLVLLAACAPEDGPPGAASGASRLIAPAGSPAQERALRDAEMVRGGDFEVGTAGHWALFGMGTHVAPEAGLRGDGRDRGLSLAVSQHGAVAQGAVQALYLPTEITAATLRLRYRMGGTQASQLQRFDVGVGLLGAQDVDPISVAVHHDMTALPPSGWQTVEHAFPSAALERLLRERRAGQRPVLWIRLVGHDVKVHVDDVSLRVDGVRRIPALPGTLVVSLDGGDVPWRVVSMAPDGSSLRAHAEAPATGSHTKGLTVSPDGSRVVFSSDHEMAFSPWSADLYQVDASGLERRTNAPSQARLRERSLPTGGVRVRVRNLGTRSWSPLMVYVQGTRVLGSVSLGPAGQGRDTADVVLPEVKDLGEGIPQTVAIRFGGRTAVAALGVDVKPGQTVDAPGEVTFVDLQDQQATQPHAHATKPLLLFSLAGLRTLDRQGRIDTQRFGTLAASEARFRPGSDDVVYVGLGGLWLLPAGASQATRVRDHPSGGLVRSPVWMPDGKGVVHVATTTHPTLGTFADDLQHVVPGGEPRALTHLLGEQAGIPAVSPDGRFIAFRRRAAGSEGGSLWIFPIADPGGAWRVPLEGVPQHLVWTR